MNKELKKDLKTVRETLTEYRQYFHASAILDFDRQTICPKEGMEAQGEVDAFLNARAYELLKDKKFIKAAERLYENRAALDKYDAVLARYLHREYLRTKKITPKMQHRFSLIYNKAFVDWIKAKEANDFSLYAPSLSAVRDAELKQISLQKEAKDPAYDNLLDQYEHGMTSAMLDDAFGECKERLIPLLEKIKASHKTIRTDFMRRKAPEERQRKMAEYLLHTMGYDFSRGAYTTSEHPFTNELGKDDVRVTTHFYEDNFASSMFSVLHEGGHALFGQNYPRADYKHFIEGQKTLGMHESVSRFYENRIGRSKAFIDLIYDQTKEFFPEVFSDASAQEFYEAVNRVEPSEIRIEADEFTYTFHIIIRYEIEKELIEGDVKIEELPARWNEKYEKYLGVHPRSDRAGVLQDVHWTGGFGYFPTYALGNMYNAMYYNKMIEKYDVDRLVAGGHLEIINDWMTKHVFKKADRLNAAEWIKDITGRAFTPKDFLDYLEQKFGAIYGL